MRQPWYIFDLDGTLSNTAHRDHFLREQPKDWDSFYSRCGLDSPVLGVIRTMDMLWRGGAVIRIWSGRRGDQRDVTIDWLATHTAFNSTHIDSMLRMREVGDHTPDFELKLKWLNALTKEARAELIAVFEDRTRMVEMWRAQGVPCFQVAPGDF